MDRTSIFRFLFFGGGLWGGFRGGLLSVFWGLILTACGGGGGGGGGDGGGDKKPETVAENIPDDIDFSERKIAMARDLRDDPYRLPYGDKYRAEWGLDYGRSYAKDSDGEYKVTYRFYDLSDVDKNNSVLNAYTLYDSVFRRSGEYETVKGKAWLEGMFESSFSEYMSVSGLKIVEEEETDSSKKVAKISYFIGDYNGGLLGYSGYPANSRGILDKDLVDEKYAYEGSALKELIIHELGHGLGLRHPFKGSSYASSERTEFEGFEVSTAYTAVAYADMPYSIYFDGTNEQIRYRDNLGLYDIAVLQRKYGANKDYNSGDTDYGVEYFEKHWIQKVIWDGGGHDTIDLSGFSFSYLEGYASKTSKALPTPRHELDLESGHFGSVGIIDKGFLPKGGLFRGYDNFVIAYGVVIENAIGGDGADILKGNGANNSLSGRGGDDVLQGRGGNDVLTGGSGDDRIIGGSGDDEAVYSAGSKVYSLGDDMWLVIDGGWVDVIKQVENIRIGSKTYSLDVATTASDSDIERLSYVVVDDGATFKGKIDKVGDVDWVKVWMRGFGAEKKGPAWNFTISGSGKIEGLYDSREGTGISVSDFSKVSVDESGAYYLKIVEGDSGVGEYTLTADEDKSLPDLEILGSDFLAEKFYARSFIYLDMKVKNGGAGYSSAGYVKAYLSSDDKWDSKDEYLGYKTFDLLKPQEDFSIITGFGLPDYLRAGEYYLILKIDTDKAIAESSEDNNAHVQKITVGEVDDGDRDIGILKGEQRISDWVRNEDSDEEIDTDKDVYKFSLESESEVGFFIDRAVEAFTVRLKVVLYKLNGDGTRGEVLDPPDVVGEEYGQNYKSGNSLYNGMYQGVGAGDYEIEVSRIGKDNQLGYEMSLFAVETDDKARNDDFKGSSDTEGVVKVMGNVRGFIEKGNDEDWFAMELEAGKTYSLSMKGQGYGRGSLWDPEIKGIVDKDSKDLSGLSIEKQRHTKDSEVNEFSVSETGKYYVKVGSGDGKIGSYSLSLYDQDAGTKFLPLRTLNSIPDLVVKEGDTENKVVDLKNVFHHYWYAVDGERDIFTLSRLGSEKTIPSWLEFDNKTGRIEVVTAEAKLTGGLYRFQLLYEFQPDGEETVSGVDYFDIDVRGSSSSWWNDGDDKISFWDYEGLL